MSQVDREQLVKSIEQRWLARAKEQNFGKPSKLHELKERFLAGQSLKEISNALGRKADAVISKLLKAELIAEYPDHYNYVYNVDTHLVPVIEQAASQPSNTPTVQEIRTMNIVTIQSKTFINERDGAELSDDAIFSMIQKMEKQIADWEIIQVKPKKLVDRIAAMRESIVKLAEYVDAR